MPAPKGHKHPIVNYFNFEDSDLRKQKIGLDVPESIVYREKNDTIERECFCNSIISADEIYDFVGGFFMDGSRLYEHAWNRSSSVILDTTFRDFRHILNPPGWKKWQCAFVEVIRLSRDELKEIFSEEFSKICIKNKFFNNEGIDQVVTFLKYCENLKAKFFDARICILDHFKPIHIRWTY